MILRHNPARVFAALVAVTSVVATLVTLPPRIPVYIINLASRPDRWAETVRAWNFTEGGDTGVFHPWHRVEARRHGDGCTHGDTASHFAILQHVCEEQRIPGGGVRPHVVAVMEDDAEPTPFTHELLRRLLAHTHTHTHTEATSWHVINLAPTYVLDQFGKGPSVFTVTTRRASSPRLLVASFLHATSLVLYHTHICTHLPELIRACQWNEYNSAMAIIDYMLTRTPRIRQLVSSPPLSFQRVSESDLTGGLAEYTHVTHSATLDLMRVDRWLQDAAVTSVVCNTHVGFAWVCTDQRGRELGVLGAELHQLKLLHAMPRPRVVLLPELPSAIHASWALLNTSNAPIHAFVHISLDDHHRHCHVPRDVRNVSALLITCALPCDDAAAAACAHELLASGRWQRPWIGVSPTPAVVAAHIERDPVVQLLVASRETVA